MEEGDSQQCRLTVPETDLDTVKTAKVGTDCSRLSNQRSQGESPWKAPQKAPGNDPAFLSFTAAGA